MLSIVNYRFRRYFYKFGSRNENYRNFTWFSGSVLKTGSEFVISTLDYPSLQIFGCAALSKREKRAERIISMTIYSVPLEPNLHTEFELRPYRSLLRHLSRKRVNFQSETAFLQRVIQFQTAIYGRTYVRTYVQTDTSSCTLLSPRLEGRAKKGHPV